MKLSNHLYKGRENAISEGDLAELLCVSPRVIAKMAERERRAGAPICAATSAPAGPYLAADQAELERYLKSLDRRLREVRLTREAVGDTLDAWTGQTKIAAWDRGTANEQERQQAGF